MGLTLGQRRYELVLDCCVQEHSSNLEEEEGFIFDSWFYSILVCLASIVSEQCWGRRSWQKGERGNTVHTMVARNQRDTGRSWETDYMFLGRLLLAHFLPASYPIKL